MEEIKNEVMENEMENYEANEEISGKGLPLGIIIGGIAVVGTGIAAARKFGKGKIDEMRVRKLEKKGYVVTKPEDIIEDEVDSNEESKED